MFVFDILAAAAASLLAALVASRAAQRSLRLERADALLREAAAGAAPRLDAGGAGPAPQAFADAALKAQAKAAQKRALDIALSLALIVFLSPVLVLTAIAVRLDTPGPVFYRQRRVGLGGRTFDLIKFRSMVTDAEPNGPQYTAVNDDRITRTGRIIRKFRIDEIPQALNVLRGEMSFVGPRPERPEFVRELAREIPLYQCRHLVKPGITGWAQVKHEYSASVEGARRKLVYDLHYIGHFSLAFDLLIVLMTVRVALFGLGSR
ncbi:MAG: sugar transferase [Parvularculaceae bacterium]